MKMAARELSNSIGARQHRVGRRGAPAEPSPDQPGRRPPGTSADRPRGPSQPAQGHARPGPRPAERGAGHSREPAAILGARLDRTQRACAHRGGAERRLERQCNDAPLRRCGPRGSARGNRPTDLHCRSGQDDRQGLLSGGPLVDRIDRAPAVRRAAAARRRRADSGAALVAIVATLEICVLIGMQLNFANIIALPLLLGVGVAFKIYYVMAWRAGETDSCGWA